MLGPDDPDADLEYTPRAGGERDNQIVGTNDSLALSLPRPAESSVF
jgi:hypothetical protein